MTRCRLLNRHKPHQKWLQVRRSLDCHKLSSSWYRPSYYLQDRSRSTWCYCFRQVRDFLASNRGGLACGCESILLQRSPTEKCDELHLHRATRCLQKRLTLDLREIRSNSSPPAAYSSTIKMSLVVSMNSKCLIMWGWLKRLRTLISLFTLSNTPYCFIFFLLRIFIATLWFVTSL